jgi:zinc transport system permease protein
VSPTDVWVILALGAVVGATLALFYRPLFAITLHEDLARTSGVPVAALNLVLALLMALTTVVAMRMVGVLLVSAMIVIPALSGFALGGSFRSATAWAVVVAFVSVTVGLVVAFYLGLAAGGAIVLTALLLFAGVSLAGRLGRGRVALARRGLRR